MSGQDMIDGGAGIKMDGGAGMQSSSLAARTEGLKDYGLQQQIKDLEQRIEALEAMNEKLVQAMNGLTVNAGGWGL